MLFGTRAKGEPETRLIPRTGVDEGASHPPPHNPHTHSHTRPERPYKCNQCEYAAVENATLQRHLEKTHHVMRKVRAPKLGPPGKKRGEAAAAASAPAIPQTASNTNSALFI